MAGRLPDPGQGRRWRHGEPALSLRLSPLEEATQPNHPQQGEDDQGTAAEQGGASADTARSEGHWLYYYGYEELGFGIRKVEERLTGRCGVKVQPKILEWFVRLKCIKEVGDEKNRHVFA